jgi:hypothetical protein
VVHVQHKLGAATVASVDIATGRGVRLAHHLRAPDGAGAVVGLDEHVEALTRVVVANFSDRVPCHRKRRRPPSADALAEAERIRRARAGVSGEQVVIDFDAYASGARPLSRTTGDQADQADQADRVASDMSNGVSAP